MKKISSKGKITKKIDSVFGAIIRLERGEICEWCGRYGSVQVSHILPKGRYPRLRFVSQNVLLLCMRCHLFVWHKNPIEAWEFIKQKFGEDYKYKLLEIEKMHDKHDMLYLEALLTSMEDRLDILKNAK